MTTTSASPRTAEPAGPFEPDPLGPPGRGRSALLGGAVLTVGALFVLHVLVGRGTLGVGDVLATLAGQAPSDAARLIVIELRLPRALIALTAGAALGLSGAVLQSVIRNPLAEPGVMGITAGGVLASVLYLALVPSTFLTPDDRGVGQFGGLALPLVTLAGGLLAGALVYLLSRRNGTDPLRIVLTGILVGSVLQAGTSLILLFRREEIGGIVLWLVGSLNGKTWLQWGALWPWAVASILLGLACAGLANALHLGDDVGAGLGLRVERTRAGLLAVGVLPTAAAVSIVGAIGFVGLIGPHIARQVVGDDARRLFPLSVLLGGGLLLVADIAAGAVPFTRTDLPVGAAMALLGGPFFLYLLTRRVR